MIIDDLDIKECNILDLFGSVFDQSCYDLKRSRHVRSSGGWEVLVLQAGGEWARSILEFVRGDGFLTVAWMPWGGMA